MVQHRADMLRAEGRARAHAVSISLARMLAHLGIRAEVGGPTRFGSYFCRSGIQAAQDLLPLPSRPEPEAMADQGQETPIEHPSVRVPLSKAHFCSPNRCDAPPGLII